jgi:hypothetical protein
MKLKVDSEILGQTTKCPHEFECLVSEEYPECEIEQGPTNIYFVKEKVWYCPYKISFGYGQLCSCPVRIEIYRQYNQ